MRFTVAEMRLIIIGVIYLFAIIFAKKILGGHENIIIFTVTAFIILYLIYEGRAVEKRKNSRIKKRRRGIRKGE